MLRDAVLEQQQPGDEAEDAENQRLVACKHLVERVHDRPLCLFHRSIDAPRPGARGRQIEEGEAVHDRQRAAVEQRIEAPRRVNHEIGDRHFTARMKATGWVSSPMVSSAPPISSMKPAAPSNENSFRFGKGRDHGTAEQLGHAVFDDHQTGDDAQHAQGARRPCVKCFSHDHFPQDMTRFIGIAPKSRTKAIKPWKIAGVSHSNNGIMRSPKCLPRLCAMPAAARHNQECNAKRPGHHPGPFLCLRGASASATRPW